MLTRWAVVAVVVVAAACSKKPKDTHESPDLPAPKPVTAPPTQAQAPYATFAEASRSMADLFGSIATGLDQAGSDCGQVGASLGKLAPSVDAVAARLGVKGDPAEQKAAGTKLLGQLECVTGGIKNCLSGPGVMEFFQSEGWKTVRHTAVEWAGPDTVAPPCPTPRKAAPHPAGVSDADAAAIEQLATDLDELGTALQAANGDCKAATKAMLAFAAKSPKDAHDKRMALQGSDAPGVMEWYMDTYNQRIGHSMVAGMQTSDACKGDKTYAAAAAANAETAFLYGF